MSIKVLQYFVHDATINGSRVGGSQTLTISKTIESSDATAWGNITLDIMKFKKRPKVSYSLQKILTDDYGPTFTPFDIRDLFPKRPVDKYDVGATIYGGGSIKLIDSILTGISYSFRSEGWFTEDLSFEGTVSEATAAGAAGTGLTRTAEGIPYQRQYFSGGTLPAEVAGQVLLGVDVNVDIGYGYFNSYGGFYTYENAYMLFPAEVTSSFEIYDRGYSQSETEHLGNLINDEINKQSILINTVPLSIDLGDKNALVSMERSGANAGTSDFSTITYTYKNFNYFKIL